MEIRKCGAVCRRTTKSVSRNSFARILVQESGRPKMVQINHSANVRTSDSADALIISLQETMEHTILETKLALSAANYSVGKILVLESRLSGQFESLRESMEDSRESLADIRDTGSSE